jgi:hypothetical protein
MLSQDVLEVDVAQYLEDNSPLDDNDLARTRKLYRLSAYRRCSRWIFQIKARNVGECFHLVFIDVYERNSLLLMDFTRTLNLHHNM